MMSVDGRKPRSGALDAVLGERIRKLRRDRGLSQTALAEQLGITFQQVQKYENGTNRISAMALVKLSAALGLSPSVLLSDLGEDPGAADPAAMGTRLERLVAAFSRIESSELQDAIVSIAESLARSAPLASVTRD
jgi:transcriptional regulator with XRE-family HTH domain